MSSTPDTPERNRSSTARNVGTRAAAEIVGKLASLVLFAAIARRLGVEQLGVFVLAFSVVQIAFVAIDLGLDRFLLREVARDRSTLGEWVGSILAAKAILAVPVLGATVGLTFLVDYTAQQQQAIAVVALALFFDSLGRTAFAALNAFERGDVLSLGLLAQRLGSAGAGLAVLAAGYGVVGVCAAFGFGTALGTAIAFVLMRRATGISLNALKPGGWRRAVGVSRAFALQDVFTQLLFRLDAVILSVISTATAVGIYGGAYRLLEATFFLTQAVSGAFSARYAYLGPESDPSVGEVFERSLKLAIVLLLPVTVVFGVLTSPVLDVIFGPELADAAEPLRILAPAVVLMSIVKLGGSLIASQRSPRILVWTTAAAVALNVALNLMLIPRYEASGAAAAMLITEALLAIAILGLASRVVGGLGWLRLLAAPASAALAATGVALALRDTPELALAAGLVSYAIAYLGVERIADPQVFAALKDRLVARRA
jgi:O-antigen/teichoic acid export membrane protein